MEHTSPELPHHDYAGDTALGCLLRNRVFVYDGTGQHLEQMFTKIKLVLLSLFYSRNSGHGASATLCSCANG